MRKSASPEEWNRDLPAARQSSLRVSRIRDAMNTVCSQTVSGMSGRFPAVALAIVSLSLWCHSEATLADVLVRTERNPEGNAFQFESIAIPAIDDAAANGKWEIVKGQSDRNSASIAVLSDGKVPSSEDSPRENFFFAAGTTGGMIALDLGKPIEIAEIATYSWHSGTRAAQVYKLYAAESDGPDFTWNQLNPGVRPEQSGWTLLANVDTRTEGIPGGQHAACINDTSGSLGRIRYLLFETQPTETDDAFGNTFFSEIDVLDRNGPPPRRITVPDVQAISFSTDDQRFHFTVDTTAAPELTAWTEDILKPVILEWYPRIVSMLPSDGFTAPEKVRLRYLPAEQMNGVPAYAQGATVSLNASWFYRELKREAAGAVVHELVHVVQSYQGRPRNQRRATTPGWIVEGIPDYIRWFLYEPQTQGAKISADALAKAKHDASYRVSANFIDWVLRNHDTNGTLLQEINTAAREGRYSSEIWEQLTGKTESQLADDWRQQ